jgi:hypothetical protein
MELIQKYREEMKHKTKDELLKEFSEMLDSPKLEEQRYIIEQYEDNRGQAD